MNVFSKIPNPMGPDGNDPDGDVKQAVALMMEQQQAGEPTPRPPTPQEAAQLKQTAMQALQAKGQMPGQAPQAQAPTPPMPPVANPKAPAALGPSRQDMIQSGALPVGAGRRPPDFSTPPPAPNEDAGPPLLPGMDNGGNTEDDYQPPKEQKGPVDYSNALDLMLKTNPATAVQNFAMKKAQAGDLPGLDTMKHGVNLAGEVAGSGKIFNDEQKPTKAEGPGSSPEAEAESDQQADTWRKGEPGSDEHLQHIAQVVAPEAKKVTDALIASGVNTPEKADVALRAQFHGDPELEKAIAEAKATYQQLQQLNNTPPTVGQYIGAILVGLAGGGPQVMQAILHPNAHLNAQREGIAGESLLKLQLAKAQGMMHQRELEAKNGQDSMAQKKLDQQMAIANQREKGMDDRASSAHNLQMIKDSIEYYKGMSAKANDAASKSVGATKKKFLQDAQNYDRQAQPFMQMLQAEVQKNAQKLQQPQQQAQRPGGPVSVGSQPGQVSPSAMRLLGMSA